VGSPVDLATALLEYNRIGISQFLFSGWPDAEEVDRFGKDVLPLVRALERQQEEAADG
jgi:alkanesulfonate monooxygenase